MSAWKATDVGRGMWRVEGPDGYRKTIHGPGAAERAADFVSARSPSPRRKTAKKSSAKK